MLYYILSHYMSESNKKININKKWISYDNLKKCKVITGWNFVRLHMSLSKLSRILNESPYNVISPIFYISGFKFNLRFTKIKNVSANSEIGLSLLSKDKFYYLENIIAIKSDNVININTKTEIIEKNLELLKTNDINILSKSINREDYPIVTEGFLINNTASLNPVIPNKEKNNKAYIDFHIFVKIYVNQNKNTSNFRNDLLRLSTEISSSCENIIFKDKDNERLINKKWLEIRIPKMYEKYKDVKIINEFDDKINEILIEYITKDSINIKKYSDEKTIISLFDTLFKISETFEIKDLKEFVINESNILSLTNILSFLKLYGDIKIDSKSFFFNKCMEFCEKNLESLESSNLLNELSSSMQAKITLYLFDIKQLNLKRCYNDMYEEELNSNKRVKI